MFGLLDLGNGLICISSRIHQTHSIGGLESDDKDGDKFVSITAIKRFGFFFFTLLVIGIKLLDMFILNDSSQAVVPQKP